MISYISYQSAALHDSIYTWIFAGKSGEYLLLLSGINYDSEKNCVIRSHLKVFVTIAVLPKNLVDYKSMPLSKSLFAYLYVIVCSYIKKFGHFWRAGLLYTGVNFENKHGFSPSTLF